MISSMKYNFTSLKTWFKPETEYRFKLINYDSRCEYALYLATAIRDLLRYCVSEDVLRRHVIARSIPPVSDFD